MAGYCFRVGDLTQKGYDGGTIICRPTVHYMVEAEPDDNWRLACLCDEPLPDVVTCRKGMVTCPKCLEVLKSKS